MGVGTGTGPRAPARTEPRHPRAQGFGTRRGSAGGARLELSEGTFLGRPSGASVLPPDPSTKIARFGDATPLKQSRCPRQNCPEASSGERRGGEGCGKPQAWGGRGPRTLTLCGPGVQRTLTGTLRRPHAVARERIRPSRSPGGTPPGSAQKGLRKTQHVAEDVKLASGGKPPRAPSWPGGTNWQRSFQGREAGTGGTREPRVIRILLEDRI